MAGTDELDDTTRTAGPVPDDQFDGGPRPEAMTIAEAARACGLSTHTLRYYERAGLMIGRVTRSPSRHRRYGDEDLRWISTLTALRRTGMPIRQMARYAALVRAGSGNEAVRLELLSAHRRQVLARLDEVTRHLSAIEAKIDLYCERIND